MELKAIYTCRVTKKIVAVRFGSENKLAASHFHYALKTESVEIRTD